MATSERQYRLPTLDYLPRVIMLGFVGAFVLAATGIDGHGPVFWLAWVVQFVVWPHLAYLRGRRSTDPKRAELQNVAVDAGMTGVWTAVCHFTGWAVILFLGGTTLTHVSLSGLRGFFLAVVLFFAGAVAAGAFTGYEIVLDTSVSVQVMGIVGAMLFMTLIASNAYFQNRRLIRAKQAVDDKNRVFESLVQLSVRLHQADDVEGILASGLSQMAELMPEVGFGVIMHDTGHPAAVRHRRSVRLPEEDMDRITAQLGHVTGNGDLFAELASGAARLYLLPLTPQSSQMQGVFAVRSRRPLDAGRTGTIRLFCDQITSALESTLLTLQLRRLASTDPLTGTYNRGYLEEALNEARRNKRSRPGTDFAMIVVDVNGLKSINDRFGHETGDHVVIATAELLKTIARDSDVLARTGGDEFVLLCNGSNASDLDEVMAQIRTAADRVSLTAHTADGGTVPLELRVSLGGASTDTVAPERLPAVADRRMYADKRSFYALATSLLRPEPPG